MSKVILCAIDAENVSHQVAAGIALWAAQQGELVSLKAYGDFKMPRMLPWRSVLSSINCEVVETPHLKAKNAADLTLAMDVIEDLYRLSPDHVIIASGDGDFIPLVTRLRDKGIEVTGMATHEASKHFKQACTSFRSFDTLPSVMPLHKAHEPLPKHIYHALTRICFDIMRDSRRNEWVATSLIGDAIANSDLQLNFKKAGIFTLTEALARHGKLEILKDGKNVYFRRLEKQRIDLTIDITGR